MITEPLPLFDWSAKASRACGRDCTAPIVSHAGTAVLRDENGPRAPHIAQRAPYPGLSAEDMKELSEAARRVHELMRDGQWHTATEIIEASGIREGLRRMRELRNLPGVSIEAEKVRGSRDFRYRMKGGAER